MKSLLCTACVFICTLSVNLLYATDTTGFVAYIVADLLHNENTRHPSPGLSVTPYLRTVDDTSVWAWRLTPDLTTTHTSFSLRVYIPEKARHADSHIKKMGAWHALPLISAYTSSPAVYVTCYINDQRVARHELQQNDSVFWYHTLSETPNDGYYIRYELTFPSQEERCAVDIIMPQIIACVPDQQAGEAPAFFFGRERREGYTDRRSWRFPSATTDAWQPHVPVTFTSQVALTRVTPRTRATYRKRPLHLTITCVNYGGRDFSSNNTDYITIELAHTDGVVPQESRRIPVPHVPAHSYAYLDATVFPHHHVEVLTGTVHRPSTGESLPFIATLAEDPTPVQRREQQEGWHNTISRDPAYIIGDWIVPGMRAGFLRTPLGLQDIELAVPNPTENGWTTVAMASPTWDLVYDYHGTQTSVRIPARRMDYITSEKTCRIRGWTTDANGMQWRITTEWRPASNHTHFTVTSTLTPPAGIDITRLHVAALDMPEPTYATAYIPGFTLQTLPPAHDTRYNFLYIQPSYVPLARQIHPQATLGTDKGYVTLKAHTVSDAQLYWKLSPPNADDTRDRHRLSLYAQNMVPDDNGVITLSYDIRVSPEINTVIHKNAVPVVPRTRHVPLREELTRVRHKILSAYTQELSDGGACMIAPYKNSPPIYRPEILALLSAQKHADTGHSDMTSAAQLYSAWREALSVDHWRTHENASAYAHPSLYAAWMMVCGDPHDIYAAAQKTLRVLTNEYAWVWGTTVQARHLLARESLHNLAHHADLLLRAGTLCNEHYARDTGIRILTLLNNISVPVNDASGHASLYACASLIDAYLTAYYLTNDSSFLETARKWAYISRCFFRVPHTDVYPVLFLGHSFLNTSFREPLRTGAVSPHHSLALAYALTMLARADTQPNTWKHDANALYTAAHAWYDTFASSGCIPDALHVAKKDGRLYAPDMMWLLTLLQEDLSPAVHISRIDMGKDSRVFVCAIGQVTTEAFPHEERYTITVSHAIPGEQRVLIINAPKTLKDVYINDNVCERSRDDTHAYRWEYHPDKRTAFIYFPHTPPQATIELFY